jgi:hypothetical protein
VLACPNGGPGLENWVVIAALLAVSLLLAVLGLALFGGVVVLLLRRRSAAAPAAEETLIKPPPRMPSQEKTAPSIPTPAKPAAAPKETKPGLAAPPPPKPLGVNPAPAKAGKPPAPPAFPSFYDDGKKGPLLGFLDDDKGGDEAKTELFSRDTAKRYAEMLDDEDDGDHTELFSNQDLDLSGGGGAILDEDSTGGGKVPGRR